MQWSSESFQFFRALAYISLILALSLLSRYVLQGTDLSEISTALMFLSLVSAGQAVASLGRIPTQGAFAFLLADAVVAAVLVRSTGSSTSPMLVLFPIISLSAAVVLGNRYLILGVIGFLLLCMSMAVGFGAAILGNTFAILTTGWLGFYLTRALTQSGQALKASEGARQRLEHLQKAILANIPSGLMSVDPEGRIIQINRVGAKILGVSDGRLLGRPVRELMPELHDQVLKLNTLVPVLSSQDEFSGDRRSVGYTNTLGQRMHLGYSVARLIGNQDEIFLGTLVVFQDLTEVMKMEEELRTSQKMVAIGKLAAGIAHEIRNPLAGISGSAQLLEGHVSLNEEDKKLLSIIQRESNRLDKLISEFLEYVRTPKIRLDRVDLAQITRNVVDSLSVSPKWKALNCKIQVQCSGTEFWVMGEANKITQILINFILNAGQAGATLVVVGMESPATLYVKDNGSGVKAEHLGNLFEPFFTTKESGTGLGLATSYKALEAMGARVQVTSPIPDFAPKNGTMFHTQFKPVE